MECKKAFSRYADGIRITREMGELVCSVNAAIAGHSTSVRRPIIQPCSRSANSHCVTVNRKHYYYAILLAKLLELPSSASKLASRREGPTLPSFLQAILEQELETTTPTRLHQALLSIQPESSQRIPASHNTSDRRRTQATRLSPASEGVRPMP